jgi:hypothetical protein
MRWVSEALMRMHHSVRRIETFSDLKAADAECDLILFGQHQPASINRQNAIDLAKHKRARWLQWWFDILCANPEIPIGENRAIASWLPLMQSMDRVFVKDLPYLDDLRQLGINAEYCDQGCPSDYPAMVHTERPEFDVLIFGQNCPEYRQRREDVQSLVQAGLSVAWAGPSNVPSGVSRLPWTHPDDLPELMSRAACILSVDLIQVAGFWSDRLWLACGAGANVVKRHAGGEPATALSLYRDHSELLNIVRDLASRSKEARENDGTIARGYTMRNATYEHRLRDILELV